MNRICPYSMASEPTECYQEECMAWSEGECSKFQRESLSQYYIAKNMKEIREELKKIRDWQ